MTKRINVSFRDQTVQLLDRVAGKRQRSNLIDRAVVRYVEEEVERTFESGWRKVLEQRLTKTCGSLLRGSRSRRRSRSEPINEKAETRRRLAGQF